MIEPVESLILCEGFHDRDFWKGWLKYLGCKDARSRDGERDSLQVSTSSGIVNTKEFVFATPGDAPVRVRPCHGQRMVLENLRIHLLQRETRPVRRLIVGLDNDAIVGEQSSEGRARALLQRVRDIVAKLDPQHEHRDDGDLALDGGRTLVSLVLWSTDDPAAPHLPAQQTLERLVCVSLCAAYPIRGDSVAAWLAARPDAPPAGPKEFAWSHMAGWYAENGCGDFYQCVWRDPGIARELRRILEASGAWRVATALVGP